MQSEKQALHEYYKQKYPLTLARDREQIQDALDRHRRAWQAACKAAAVLKRDFGASKVAAFGSLVDRSRFTCWSDIDLAVWDVADEDYFRALVAVSSICDDMGVDLVDPDSCKTSVRRTIESEGVEL